MNEERKIPWVSWGLVLLMIVVFSMEKRAMSWGIINFMLDDFAFSWIEFVRNPLRTLPSLVSHTFLHANESHLIGNAVFFMLFAPAVERRVGGIVFLVFYFIWGIAAAFAQGFFSPFSSGLIGASGAISGAAGAFFVLYPLKLPPLWLSRIFGRWVSQIPAFFLIGLWFVGQLHDGFRSLMPDPLSGQVTLVAHWAHIGGFACGALTMFPFFSKN